MRDIVIEYLSGAPVSSKQHNIVEASLAARSLIETSIRNTHRKTKRFERPTEADHNKLRLVFDRGVPKGSRLKTVNVFGRRSDLAVD